jgi:uncharacterized repeat protein (TIGR04138 family)
MKNPEIAEILRRDARYAYEAYEFIFEALSHTQKLVGRLPIEGAVPGADNHVSGREIVQGAIDLARREFGLMARTVFHQWGITQTDDLGELVFNLIESSLLSKTDNDNRADFRNVLDLDRALVDGYTITLQEPQTARRGGR